MLSRWDGGFRRRAKGHRVSERRYPVNFTARRSGWGGRKGLVQCRFPALQALIRSLGYRDFHDVRGTLKTGHLVYATQHTAHITHHTAHGHRTTGPLGNRKTTQHLPIPGPTTDGRERLGASCEARRCRQSIRARTVINRQVQGPSLSLSNRRRN